MYLFMVVFQEGSNIRFKIMFKIFSDFLIFYKTFLSPQVQWNVIISNKNDTDQFSHVIYTVFITVFINIDIYI